jgi:hypothetical protein
VLSVFLSGVLLAAVAQAPQTPAPKTTAPATKSQTWVGCLQAASVPSTFRLNLDAPEGTPVEAERQGGPFVQLLTRQDSLDLASHVGRRVRVRGRELTAEEAAREASRRPDQQEANETAAGTGGRPQQHFRYVEVESLSSVPGRCR